MLILTDIHPVLSEVTKFGTFEDNLNLYCGWGRYAIAKSAELNDTEIWSYCLRISYKLHKKMIKEMLEDFVEKKFCRHIEKGVCCVNECDKERTLLINITSLFNGENRKLKRIYNCVYCSHHFKENRHHSF